MAPVSEPIFACPSNVANHSCAGQSPSEFAKALGRNEMEWIKLHASPRMNYHGSCQDHELPDDDLALLTQYMDVAPYLVPSSTDKEATSNVLWHPDLHLDNVFVDPETHDITSIVDWQSASIAPLFYQSNIPRMFKHTQPIQEAGWTIPERPENFNELSQDEQKKIDNDLECEIMHKYYAAQVCKRAPFHWTVLQQPMVPMIRKPVWLVSGVWENKDLFFLCQSLIELATHWDDISPEIPCPIKFTEKDIELHSKEEENMDGVGQMLALFRDQGVLPVDGMVEPKDYETARENSRKFKDMFIGLAKDEAERELFTKIWPYQE